MYWIPKQIKVCFKLFFLCIDMINPPIYFLNVFYFVEEPCVERNIRPYIYGTGFCVATYNNCPYREGFVNKLYSLYSFCHFFRTLFPFFENWIQEFDYYKIWPYIFHLLNLRTRPGCALATKCARTSSVFQVLFLQVWNQWGHLPKGIRGLGTKQKGGVMDNGGRLMLRTAGD